ncbi:hypothetical protein CRUP_017986 [Coryphaenoides rupestris]|nr:hypothetical protein CRUP_017986 [Coryphaenoides rupestris]
MPVDKATLPPRPNLFDFHGVSMVNIFTSNWENVQNFQARPDDILIATYPKAGTTWVSYILDLLYFSETQPDRQTSTPIHERVPFLEIEIPNTMRGTDLADNLTTSPRLIKTHLPVQLVPQSFWEQKCRVVYVARNAKDNVVSYFHFDRMNNVHPEPGDWSSFLQRFMDGKNRQTSTPIHERVPFLEIEKPNTPRGTDLADNLTTSPRLIKTHLPVQLIPQSFWEQKCRVVYVARNAKDNVVSYFHFDRMNNVHPEPGDWSSFLQRFMDGKMVFGPWYDHVTGWWERKQSYPKLHYMFFEDMIEDTGREIDKLCSFLGLTSTPEERKHIRDVAHFDNMKKDKMANYSTFDEIMDFSISPFMRKGKVGDWKNHFTATLPPRQNLFDFHGVSMVNIFTSNWENVQNFQARPDDILIATYPKAGTTWVSYILDLLYFSETQPDRQTSTPIHERVPFLEIEIPNTPSGTDLADNLTTSPRLIKTHLPVQLVPQSFWEQKCRVVYVARNAKDNVVSYFHFDRMNNVHPEPGDWSSFLQRFMDGKMVFGPWYDHVTGWWERKQSYPKLHYMFFEDMIEDTGREIDKLCSFLGSTSTPEERKHIRDVAHFDNMKKDKMANYTVFDGIMDFSVSPFMRKGKVGDWKNHFTVTQNEQFDEDYKEKMKNTTLQFRTEI